MTPALSAARVARPASREGSESVATRPPVPTAPHAAQTCPYLHTKAYPSDTTELPLGAARASRSSNYTFSMIFLSTTGKAYPSDAVSIELLSDATRASQSSNHTLICPARLTRLMLTPSRAPARSQYKFRRTRRLPERDVNGAAVNSGGARSRILVLDEETERDRPCRAGRRRRLSSFRLTVLVRQLERKLCSRAPGGSRVAEGLPLRRENTEFLFRNAHFLSWILSFNGSLAP
ncbi:hypothetical protein DPX16_5751 [Anabarilius grahami]|uniref:Uncharacterized protein n=1 Tax=Anabarilius grahami TaxID=495550 RepID=A0A3N0ZA38_ANAGA|nr:hypothetical protein DPX16_5751 [Anabarilius grahami]